MDTLVNLAKLHDDQVIGSKELAVLLNTTAGQVYKLSATAPDHLPPRLRIFGRKLAWRLGTCREWLRNLDEVVPKKIPGSKQEKRHGRPRAA